MYQQQLEDLLLASGLHSAFQTALQMYSVLAQSLGAKHKILSLKKYELKVQMNRDAAQKKNKKKTMKRRRCFLLNLAE